MHAWEASSTTIPTRMNKENQKNVRIGATKVCGPMNTLSHNQNRYFISFIDDLTCMTQVYFMRKRI